MDLILPNLLSDDPEQITFSLQASVSFPRLLHSPHTHTHTLNQLGDSHVIAA